MSNQARPAAAANSGRILFAVPQGWMATIFDPAARVEARWIGCEVLLTYTETAGPALLE